MESTTAGRLPSEFRYFDPARRETAQRLRRWASLFGVEPLLPDDVVRTLGAMYFDADPLAEAFVRDTYLAHGSRHGRALLERAIAHGAPSIPDAPASLGALFDDVEREPAWLDWERVEHGARVFRRWGSHVFRFAGAITLAAYAESSVAKPLSLTGAYSGATAKKRFLETAAFWIAVSEPGGLRPGMPGRASALRVRVMHVFVRQRLRAHPEWDEARWGVPISQGDALLTLMGGSVAPGIALSAMGFRASRRDIEATLHFWRFVGHLMGVTPRWYPTSIEDALRLALVNWLKRAETAGEDGVELSRSFAEAFAPQPKPNAPLRERLRDVVEHGVHRGTTRFFLPRGIARRQGVPAAGPWVFAPLVGAPVRFAAETLRRHLPALDDVADARARRERAAWLARHAAGHPAEYRPAERFTR
jgi:hypothetical protein